ncbi:MAG: hypothetical protein EON54_15940, partial [Alcaligenaceae bacterium]
MVMNLRWFEACSASRAFSESEKASGWPWVMRIEQLAAIQRPYAVEDSRGREAQEALRDAMEAFVKSGGLDGIQLGAEFSGNRPMTAEEAAGYGGMFGDGSGWFTPTGERPFYGVTPRDFAQWLHAQGEQPSAHVLEWFKVFRVAWPSVGADATVAGASPSHLADFAALVIYRKAQKAANVAAGKPRKNIPWTDGNQLDVLHAEYGRLGKKTSAAESMAKDLGTTR